MELCQGNRFKGVGRPPESSATKEAVSTPAASKGQAIWQHAPWAPIKITQATPATQPPPLCGQLSHLLVHGNSSSTYL